jgi:hypothetical protein
MADVYPKASINTRTRRVSLSCGGTVTEHANPHGVPLRRNRQSLVGGIPSLSAHQFPQQVCPEFVPRVHRSVHVPCAHAVAPEHALRTPYHLASKAQQINAVCSSPWRKHLMPSGPGPFHMCYRGSPCDTRSPALTISRVSFPSGFPHIPPSPPLAREHPSPLNHV